MISVRTQAIKKIQYTTPRCEVISLATPCLLGGSVPVAEERLMIGFDDSAATEEAY